MEHKEVGRQKNEISVGVLDRLNALWTKKKVAAGLGICSLGLTTILTASSGEHEIENTQSECIEAAEDTAQLDSEVQDVIDRTVDTVVEENEAYLARGGGDWDNSIDPPRLIGEEIGVEFVDDTVYREEYLESFRESESFEEAAKIVGEFAKKFYNIDLILPESTETMHNYSYTPLSRDSYGIDSPLYGVMHELNNLPQNFVEDIKLNSFKLRIVNEIHGSSEQPDAHGLALYNDETHRAEITLTSDAAQVSKPPFSSMTLYHELGHIVDHVSYCSHNDPQFEGLDPSWLTPEARQGLAREGHSLPTIVMGGNYGLSAYGEEKAGGYTAIFARNEPAEDSEIIEQKYAILFERLHTISDETAEWLWYDTYYSNEDSFLNTLEEDPRYQAVQQEIDECFEEGNCSY